MLSVHARGTLLTGQRTSAQHVFRRFTLHVFRRFTKVLQRLQLTLCTTNALQHLLTTLQLATLNQTAVIAHRTNQRGSHAEL